LTFFGGSGTGGVLVPDDALERLILAREQWIRKARFHAARKKVVEGELAGFVLLSSPPWLDFAMQPHLI